MPSPIPATAYSTAQVVQPTAFKAPAREMAAPTRDLFGQGASGQDMAVLNAVPAGTVTGAPAAAETAEAHPLFGSDGFTFSDFLDIINPLQHIPVVSTIYRAVTGDKIDPGSRVAGGGLFGGPIGMVLSMVSGMIEESTGKDPGEHALAALGIDIGPNRNRDTPATMVAAAPAAALADASASLDQVAGQMPAPQEAAPPPLKIGVTTDGSRNADKSADKPVDKTAEAKPAAIELPSDLFQALKQTAAVQQADAKAAAANSATANPVPPAPDQRAAGPMQTNAMPSSAIRAPDGRSFFPAFPAGGGGAPTRSVGTSPVTQQTVAAKFGVSKGNSFASTPQAATAASAAAIQGGDSPQNEWANRASEAYQKYFEMQDQKNRRAGIVP